MENARHSVKTVVDLYSVCIGDKNEAVKNAMGGYSANMGGRHHGVKPVEVLRYVSTADYARAVRNVVDRPAVSPSGVRQSHQTKYTKATVSFVIFISSQINP